MKVIKGVGGLKHEQYVPLHVLFSFIFFFLFMFLFCFIFRWRSFANERRVAEARNFIDGDLIEAFLDLPPEKMQEVVEARQGGTPLDMSVDDLIKYVEELAGLH